RAQQTAHEISKFHPGIQHDIMSDLAEICWGVFEGKMSPDLSSLKKAWEGGNFDFAPMGGESPSMVCVRVERAFSEIVRKARELKPDSEATVVIVAHGRFLRIALSWLLHQSLYFMETITHTNCNLNVLDVCKELPTTPLIDIPKDQFDQLANRFFEQQSSSFSDKPKHLFTYFSKLNHGQAHVYSQWIGSYWTWNEQTYFVMGKQINDTMHLVLQ
ncbi:hypothetical protein HMI56_002020, partial [Coelomomyces lativittatus]